jgi:hypothetical protein
MIMFEIEYFEDKSVKSYVAIKNGIQFGPKLVFHDTSNLESCECEYAGRSYGTAMQWIDVGDRFWDMYYMTSDVTRVIDRDALLTLLTVISHSTRVSKNSICKNRLQPNRR